MELLLYFMPAIVLLGIVTSYEDIQGRGIRNMWISTSLVYSVAATVSIIAYLTLIGQEARLGYITDYFINILIALGFGFGIWKAGFWSAGDGKLFLAYAALVPLSAYSIGYVRLFPSFTLFINTILIVFTYLVGSLLLRTGMRKKAEALRKTFNRSTILMAVLSLFGLSWLIRLAFTYSGIEFDMFSFIVLVPILYLLLSRIAKDKAKWFFVVVLFCRVAFDLEYLMSLDFVIRFAYIVAFFVGLKYFIFGLSYEVFSGPVEIERLSPGMVLADAIYERNGKYEVRAQTFVEFPLMQKDRGKLAFDSRGLTEQDVARINRLHQDGKLGPDLRVQSTMPFAIFMFLGVLLTVLFQGNVIIAGKLMLGL